MNQRKQNSLGVPLRAGSSRELKKPQRQEEAIFTFHKYDENKSGYLDLEQMQKCFAELGYVAARAKRTEEEVKEWVRREFKRADTDKDGKVQMAEFVAYYNQYIAGARKHFEDLYEIKEALGKGAFGLVLKAVRKQRTQSESVAVKQLIKSEGFEMDLIRNEIAIWRQLSHPNLVGLLDVFETQDHLLLVTELMRGGDLFNQLQERATFSEAEAVLLARQIVGAVGHLHAHGVVHCDLKPSNILVQDLPKSATDPNAAFDMVVKIADFGLSQSMVKSSSTKEGGKKTKLTEVCGTPDYFAPELVALSQLDQEVFDVSDPQHGYGPPLDCWAVGCIIYELLAGKPPFQAQDEQVLFYKIAENAMTFPNELFGAITQPAKELILALTKTDAAERLSCVDALTGEWLARRTAGSASLQQSAPMSSEVQRKRRHSAELRELGSLPKAGDGAKEGAGAAGEATAGETIAAVVETVAETHAAAGETGTAAAPEAKVVEEAAAAETGTAKAPETKVVEEPAAGEQCAAKAPATKAAEEAAAAETGTAKAPEMKAVGEAAAAETGTAKAPATKVDEEAAAGEPATAAAPETKVVEEAAAGETVAAAAPEKKVVEEAAAGGTGTAKAPATKVDEEAAAAEPAQSGHPHTAACEPSKEGVPATAEGANKPTKTAPGDQKQRAATKPTCERKYNAADATMKDGGANTRKASCAGELKPGSRTSPAVARSGTPVSGGKVPAEATRELSVATGSERRSSGDSPKTPSGGGMRAAKALGTLKPTSTPKRSAAK